VKIVKKERDPPLFTSKQLMKIQKILRNTTQVFDDFHFCRSRVIGLDMTENRIFTLSYDNLSSVSQNVLKFYQQLTGEERRESTFCILLMYTHVMMYMSEIFSLSMCKYCFLMNFFTL
jgi:hypothetical protein